MELLSPSPRSTAFAHVFAPCLIAGTTTHEPSRGASAGPWQTRGGAAVFIRPIHAADLELLRDFVQSLSPETRYKRYMSGRTPSDEEIARWVDIDSSHGYSLVAVERDRGEKLLAEARYVIESPDEAEFAIAIDDRAQGQGLGRELMTRLICAARCEGLRRLKGVALSTNAAMLALARKLGFRVCRTPGAGWESSLSLDLGS